MENQYLVSGVLKRKHVTSISPTTEPAIWSCDSGKKIPQFNCCQLTITVNVQCQNCIQGGMPGSTCFLDYGRHQCCAMYAVSRTHAERTGPRTMPLAMITQMYDSLISTDGYGAPLCGSSDHWSSAMTRIKIVAVISNQITSLSSHSFYYEKIVFISPGAALLQRNSLKQKWQFAGYN